MTVAEINARQYTIRQLQAYLESQRDTLALEYATLQQDLDAQTVATSLVPTPPK